MSGPFQTLEKSNRLPSGKPVVTHAKPKVSVLKTNEEIEDGTTVATDSNTSDSVVWTPPENWMIEKLEDFVTTEKNYSWRKARSLTALKFLLQNPNQLIEQPTQYIFDIRWFRYLSSGKHCQVETFLHESQQDFIKEGLPQLFKSFFTDSLNITTFQEWESANPDSVEALYHMLMALWFISTNPIHRQEMYAELFKYILAIVSSDAFRKSTSKVKRVQDTLKALLGIIFQFVKYIPEARDVMRECKGIEVIQAIASGKRAFNKNIKGRALMILAYVLTEDEQKQSAASNTIIEFLIDLLRSCLSTKEHKSPTYNYNALEILDGLNKIAVSDANKVTINEHGGLKLYGDLLDEGSIAEQEEACRGIWILCFDKSVATEVSQNLGIMKALQNLANSDQETLKSAAAGCLWTVQQQKDDNPKISEASNLGHVMISYNWSVQDEARELKEVLHNNGYRVWMDIENMSGSTLSAMSQAIEKAVVVLILVSEKYKTSPACRAEAEYAYKLQREFIPLKVQQKYSPDGWLGLLLGMKLSFDLSNQEEKSSIYQQLIKALGDKGKGDPIEEVKEFTSTQSRREAESKLTVITKSAEPVRNKSLECCTWNEDEVTAWFKKNQLEEVVSRLGGKMNGETLVELKYMLHYEASNYYDIVKQDLQLPAVSLLRLSASLRALT